jgi:hypothetical protein
MKKILVLLVLAISYQCFAQDLKVLKVENVKENPLLKWFVKGNDLKAKKFEVWRASLKEKKFDRIQTLHFVDTHKKDTLVYTVLDTTLTKKAIYQYYIKLKSNNESKQIVSQVVYGHNIGYIPNPMIISFNITSSKTEKAINLNWKLNYNFSVRSLSVFRSSHNERDFIKIAELKSNETHYTDYVPLSNHNYFYFILIADYFGYQHPCAPTPGFCTYKVKPFKPIDFTLEKVDNKVKLAWKNIKNDLSGYVVYRSINNNKFSPLHVMQTANNKKEVFYDSIPKNDEVDLKLKYFVVNIGDSYLESTTSDTLSLFIDKHLKLLPPKEFRAFSKENNQIKFIWSLTKNNRIMGYNIYQIYPVKKKINRKIIPRINNYYSDSIFYKSGKYQFAIESIGRENEKSKLKAKTSISILSAYHHLVVNLQQYKDKVIIKWKELPSDKIKSISLYRQEEENKPILIKKYNNIDAKYEDTQLKKDKVYFYSFYADLVSGEHILLNNNISVNR